jgi:hypothetical protein
MKIYITTESRGAYRLKVSSPDRDDFFAAIEALKNSIAPYHREYDGGTRQWLISGDGDSADCLYSWLDEMEVRFNAEAIWNEEKKQSYTRPHKQAETSPVDLFATLHLLPTAPPELIKAAYRTLASLTHPDHGGDELKMKRLNLAYEKLRAA